MGKTIVLTGASGYIGSAVTKKLVARGDNVVALARNAVAASNVEALGATALHGELTDASTLRDAAIGADAAIHLGATNDEHGPAADLAAARALLTGLSGKPYVHTGGCWVYGSTDGLVDETAPFAPPQLTAWRLDNEREVLEAADAGGHPVIVMPGLVVGHGGGIPQGIFVGDEWVGYLDDGASHWSLVHVDDLADLYLRAVDSGRSGEAYLGVSEVLTTKQVAEALAKARGNPDEARPVSLDDLRGRFGGLADALALDQQLSGKKAGRELGWVPAHTDLAADLAAGR